MLHTGVAQGWSAPGNSPLPIASGAEQLNEPYQQQTNTIRRKQSNTGKRHGQRISTSSAIRYIRPRVH
jgi:hypothetical protein